MIFFGLHSNLMDSSREDEWVYFATLPSPLHRCFCFLYLCVPIPLENGTVWHPWVPQERLAPHVHGGDPHGNSRTHVNLLHPLPQQNGMTDPPPPPPPAAAAAAAAGQSPLSWVGSSSLCWEACRRSWTQRRCPQPGSGWISWAQGTRCWNLKKIKFGIISFSSTQIWKTSTSQIYSHYSKEHINAINIYWKERASARSFQTDVLTRIQR